MSDEQSRFSRLKEPAIMVVSLGATFVLFTKAWSAWGAAAILACILIHEAGHIWMARRGGARLERLLVTPFGAIAFLDSPPDRERDNYLISVMGPLWGTSAAVAAAVAFMATGERAFAGIALFAGMLNGFNLLPFYPLDGGRMLAATLSPRWPSASVWLSAIGCLFAFAMLFLTRQAFWAVLGVLLAFTSKSRYACLKAADAARRAMNALWRIGFLRTSKLESGLHAAILWQQLDESIDRMDDKEAGATAIAYCESLSRPWRGSSLETEPKPFLKSMPAAIAAQASGFPIEDFLDSENRNRILLRADPPDPMRARHRYLAAAVHAGLFLAIALFTSFVVTEWRAWDAWIRFLARS